MGGACDHIACAHRQDGRKACLIRHQGTSTRARRLVEVCECHLPRQAARRAALLRVDLARAALVAHGKVARHLEPLRAAVVDRDAVEVAAAGQLLGVLVEHPLLLHRAPQQV